MCTCSLRSMAPSSTLPEPSSALQSPITVAIFLPEAAVQLRALGEPPLLKHLPRLSPQHTRGATATWVGIATLCSMVCSASPGPCQSRAKLCLVPPSLSLPRARLLGESASPALRCLCVCTPECLLTHTRIHFLHISTGEHPSGTRPHRSGVVELGLGPTVVALLPPRPPWLRFPSSFTWRTESQEIPPCGLPLHGYERPCCESPQEQDTVLSPGACPLRSLGLGWRPVGHMAAHPPHLLLSSLEADLYLSPLQSCSLPSLNKIYYLPSTRWTHRQIASSLTGCFFPSLSSAG